MEICLYDLYSWSSCNDGITFRLSKKIKERAPEAKGTHTVIHRCAPATRTLLPPLKNVLDSTIKISSITSNQEALTPACLKNSAKTCFRHTGAI